MSAGREREKSVWNPALDQNWTQKKLPTTANLVNGNPSTERPPRLRKRVEKQARESQATNHNYSALADSAVATKGVAA